MAGDRRTLALRAARDRAMEIRWQTVQARGPDSFATFCAYFVEIVTETPGVVAPLHWNDIQRQFNYRRTGWDVVLKARRVGFTTVELARDLWFALTRPTASVGIIVPPHKENIPRKKLISTIKHVLKRMGRPLGDTWSGATVTFANGSSVTVLDAGGSELAAGKLGRGDAYHRLHIAELAHYPYAASMLEALLPTVPPIAQGGELTVESTPRGVGGAYYDVWQAALAGLNGLTPHFYPWWWMAKYAHGTDTSPAVASEPAEAEVLASARAVGVVLTVAQLAWWRRQVSALGLRKVLQEYPHDAKRCFLLSGESYFDADALERLDLAAATNAPMTMAALDALAGKHGPAQAYVARLAAFHRTTSRGGQPLLRVWHPPQPGGSYIIPVDCAGGGINGDWLVALVLRRTPVPVLDALGRPVLGTNKLPRTIRRHEATLRARVTPSEFARWVHRLALAYGSGLVVVERNNHGGTVIHVLEEELEYPHLWRDAKGHVGWYTGPHNRTAAIDDFADALVREELWSADPVLAAEGRTFVHTKNGRVEADKGCHDDLVMAGAIGWNVLNGPRSPAQGPRAGLVHQPAP